jgi:parallel beta-helix repeat protein
MVLLTIRRLVGGRRKSLRTAPPLSVRLEVLEDRSVPSTLTVANNPALFPHAQYSTINAAVAAAKPGDTVEVFSGTYNESVTVDKTLTIEGEARKGPVIVDPGTQGSGFTVQANDVKIEGFTVQDAVGNPGISLSRSFSGYVIEDNVLKDNTFGLYLNSSGADRTVVRDNTFMANEAAGPASGNGIYSDQGVTNAVIEDNRFTPDPNANAAIIFVGNGTPSQTQRNLTIRDNSIDHNGAIILANVSDSTITHNLSVGSDSSGIFFGGNVTGVVVSHNTLRDGNFSGINLLTDPTTFAGATGPNTNNQIVHNDISGFGDSGIRLRGGASDNLIAYNTIVHNGFAQDPTLGSETGDGITLEDAQNNTISHNRVENNRRDGIHVEAPSAQNRIVDNHLEDNGRFDAYDATTGTGTAGTANTWKGNFGNTENVPGLLEHSNHGHGHDHGHGDGNDDGNDHGD